MLAWKAKAKQLAKTARDKTIDRYITIWLHQNTLLWGRLQAIGVLQIAVISGSYSLLITSHTTKSICFGFLLALLGASVSWQLDRIIRLDLHYRRAYRDRIGKLEPNLFKGISPLGPQTQGQVLGHRQIIQLSGTFKWINYIILLIAGGWLLGKLLFWIACGQ